jgi:hypothetical protein
VPAGGSVGTSAATVMASNAIIVSSGGLAVIQVESIFDFVHCRHFEG